MRLLISPKKVLFFVGFICLLLAVNFVFKKEPLPYQVVGQGTSFRFTDPKHTEGSIPDKQLNNGVLAIISKEQAADYFTGMDGHDVARVLNNLDYDHNFVLLFFVGHIPDNSIIDQVYRRRNEVVILMKQHDIGPGEYIVPGWTNPVDVISISKEGKWGEDIRFVIKTKSGWLLGDNTFYIP